MLKTIHVVAAVIVDGDRIFATQRGYGDWKDYWEFPGGKIEPGETPEEALRREIREELETEIAVGEKITTIEYDYPEFHLSMDCFLAKVKEGGLVLKEHEAAKWLHKEELDSVNWLPADRTIIELLKGKVLKNIKEFDHKRVRVTDKFGESFTGFAEHCSAEYCMHEYGREEDAVMIGDVLIYESQVADIEEIQVHGTAELWTERLILRRYRPEDAPALHQYLGTDPVMYQYSGWNPYATLEMAQETVRKYIESYDDEHFYSWVIDADDVLFGIIGGYDYKEDQINNKEDQINNKNDRIEVGFSIIRPCWGRGYATEALKEVLNYLTENEGISSVSAWCAAENIGSRRALEKAGMKLVNTEKNGLIVGDRVYDKLIFEYRRQ